MATTKEAFRDYLINHSPTVNADSTIKDYVYRVERVCKEEGLNWEQAAGRIDFLVKRYDTGGEMESFGTKSNRSVINALKQFADFAHK